MVFDRQITLLKRAVTTDSSGDRLVTYSEEVTTFAEKVYRRGGERTAAAQTVGTITELFRIRYRDDIRQVDRIRFEGNQYNIRSVEEENRKQFLVLECEKLDNNA